MKDTDRRITTMITSWLAEREDLTDLPDIIDSCTDGDELADRLTIFYGIDDEQAAAIRAAAAELAE